MKICHLVPAAAILAAVLPHITPVQAAAAPANAEAFSETAKHNDLDLTEREDIARLDARIETRIRRLCTNGGRDFASLRLERECREAARSSAEVQVRLAVAEANTKAVRLAETNDASPADTPGA
ncbi:MAG: UrcA family protein [Erythrobacter sp.]